MAATAKYTDGAEQVLTQLDRFASPVFRIKHWQWVVLIVALTLALRLGLALPHEPYLGIDGGAYVLSALEVQGKNATSVGFPRPPLAPGWLLVPFIELWGIDFGYKVWAVLFSFLPFIPVYLLTRDLVNKSAAIFALAFFSVDMLQMEMMVTGSLPLIGFTCIGLAVWCVFRLSSSWSKLHFGLLAGSVGVLPYINQTAAGIGGIVLPLVTMALFILVRREKGQDAWPYQLNLIRYVLPAALIGGIIALGSLPWYLANAPGNSELRFPGTLLIFVNWFDPALLIQFPISVILVFATWKVTKDYRMRTIAVVISVLSVMILFLSYDEAVVNLLFRPRYFLPILVYPTIAFLLCRTFPLLPSLRKEWDVAVPMVAVWLFLFGWGQWYVFDNQVFFKDMVFPSTANALEISKAEHPQKAVITNSYSLSHWVAALNQVESPNTWSLEPSPYYKESDEHVRCLLGWVAGCQPEAAAAALNAGYILIDGRRNIWAPPVYGAPTEDTWGNMPSVPWLRLRYAEGTLKLWEVEF